MQTNKCIKTNKHLLIFIVFLSLSFTIKAQGSDQLNIKGIVLEGKSKTGLSGATIHLQGSTNAVTTNEKGEFTITTYKKIPLTIFISFVGYQTQDIKVFSTAPLVITLLENSNQLAEVAIVGYGTQRRKDVTGSIASIPKENLNLVTPSFDNMLQGAVAGVNVTQSSGQPGATSSIRIRGGNSLSFGNDPLYVIDGFIYYNDNGITNLNPSSGAAV